MSDNLQPWSREEFEQKLRERGRGYHINHPFHVMMYEGKLTKEQLQCWVANRFYYQIAIPIKDAAILSNCPDIEVCAAAGSSEFSIMTAAARSTKAARAASKPGCNWEKPSA